MDGGGRDMGSRESRFFTAERGLVVMRSWAGAKDLPIRATWWLVPGSDVVCINQQDVDERNEQVRLMALIYSRAEEVFVCFDDDDEVNQYFDRVSELMFDYGQAWREWKDISSRQGQPLKAIEANPIDDLLIVDFVDTTWWYRVWTAQEFLLASDWISYFEQPKVEVGVANPSPNGRPASLSVNGSMLLHTTNIKRLIRHRNINLFEPETIDALDLVAFSRYRGGSDLRDKVYAFAGLSSSLPALINDEVSVQDCYENFARSIITSRRDLDIFSHLVVPDTQNPEKLGTYRYQTTSDLDSLASWAPNWSLDFPLRDFYALDDRAPHLMFHRACGDTKADTTYLGQGRLRVGGIACTTVKLTGLPYSSVHSRPKTALSDWIRTANGLSPGHCHTDQTAPPELLRRALTHDLPAHWILQLPDWSKKTILEASHRTREYSQLDHDVYARLLNQVMEHDDYPDPRTITDAQSPVQVDWGRYFYFVFASAVGRRFVVDSLGNFGFAPAQSEAGDLICALRGGKMLYVLRRVAGSSTPALQAAAEPALYRILGDAYINDLISGEADRGAA